MSDNNTFKNFEVYIDNIKNNEKTMRFDIKGNKDYGLSKSIMNGIRRTLLSNIDTVAFDVQDIKIITNNGKLHNEFLKDRISLIPLYIDPNTYHRNLLFKLHVKVTDMQILNVTCDMFDIYPLKQEYEELLEEQAGKDISIEENIYNKIESMSTEYYDMNNPLSFERKKEIFRPFKFRNYELSYFFITELKNTNSEDINEEIELYCCPTIGYSKDHARWNNIPIAVSTFKKDEDLLKKAIEEEMKINKIKDKDNFIKDFTISNSERYFHKDNNLEPYWYDFTLQSNHIYTPKELFIRSIDILINKFDIVNKNLLILKNKSLKANESEDEDDTEDDINDYSFNKLKVDNTYTLTMVNENDTVGNIIQTHAVDKYIDDTSYITFCGYKKPHPLINKIIFNLMVSPSDNNEQQKLMYIINFFINVNKDIIEIFKKIKDESENKLPS